MKKLLEKQNSIKTMLILYTFSIVLDLHVFYNRISTLIRVLIISIFFVIVFVRYATRKERKYLLLYFFMLLIYLVMHLLNLRNNNLLSECLYFLKMLMPLMLVFTIYKLDIKFDCLKKVVNPCILFISGSIVLCNLFKLGFSSYSFGALQGNIFSWFQDSSFEYYQVSGKGYFHLANQIVAIILLYLPIILVILKEKFNGYNLFVLCIALLSLLIIGNRISSWAPIIVIVIAIFLDFFITLLKKNKIDYRLLLGLLFLVLCYGLIFSQSPIIKREGYYNDLVFDAQNNESNEIDEQLETILSGTVININFPRYYYPYENDPEFWNNLIQLPDERLVDSRFIEIKIVQRIIELNNNYFKDRFLGIGYDRIINIQNIERDYVMQYYSIGIIGCVLFLGGYFALLLYLGFKIFINLEKKFTYRNLMLLMGICLVLLAAYFSGNLLNSISVMIPLCFVLGVTLNEVRRKEQCYNRILGFKVCSLSEEEIIKKLDGEISQGKQNIIFNINPLIVANFYKDYKIVEEFNKEKYNIPDGIGTVFALKMKDGDVTQRIAGVDLVDNIVAMAEKRKYKIYLYGSKDGVAVKAKEELEKKYPKIKIVGTLSGYEKEAKALKDIVQKQPDILFVALGSPKQELFIINNKRKLKNIKVIMPVGGSLDVISNTVKRAPEQYSKWHLEWLYRMVKEPKRIKKNLNLFKFVFLVLFRNSWYNEKKNGEVND